MIYNKREAPVTMNNTLETGTKKNRPIPYGIADYERIRNQGYYYVDKTAYLEILEKAGSYLFLIRPRRFGKSLLLSMLESYYDILNKNRFDELFKGTRVYDKPTPEKNSYLVLSFNFSLVEPCTEKLEASFLHHTRGRALSFLRKYESLFGK
ncbi:MAG: AAA family ATPase, partial [bacterium]|nr:AAA family ATPase [bacterium]